MGNGEAYLTTEYDVHFLKSESFRLRNKEPDEGRAAEGKDPEDEVGAV